MVSIYFITLASNRENLFDIFHAAHLKQPAFYKQDLYVVGIASGYEEALELIQRMIDDIYRKTGRLCRAGILWQDGELTVCCI